MITRRTVISNIESPSFSCTYPGVDGIFHNFKSLGSTFHIYFQTKAVKSSELKAVQTVRQQNRPRTANPTHRTSSLKYTRMLKFWKDANQLVVSSNVIRFMLHASKTYLHVDVCTQIDIYMFYVYSRKSSGNLCKNGKSFGVRGLCQVCRSKAWIIRVLVWIVVYTKSSVFGRFGEQNLLKSMGFQLN